MNHKSEVELSHFNLSMQRARKIALRKQKLGEFTRVEEILELDGFGIKVLEKFCNSILSSSGEVRQEDDIEEKSVIEAPQKKLGTFVTPPLVENVRKRIKSCVAFHVDLNYIGWAKLSVSDAEKLTSIPPITNSIVLDEWASFEIGHEDKKQSLSDLIEVLINLNDLIPPADVYVLESLPSQQASKQPGNIVQMNVNVQKSQLFAMLSVLVATRGAAVKNVQDPEVGEDAKGVKKQPPVYFLKNYLSSRLYRTFIGNERVSTALTIEEIFKQQPLEMQPHGFRYVEVPYELRSQYSRSSNIHRDFMGQSFLNGLAFIKLCVLKCPGTADMLVYRRKKV